MARPRSKVPVRGVRKRLADGTIAIYYYDRETGRALGTNLEAAIAAATPKITESGGPGTLAAAITDYRAGARFQRVIKDGTREMYGRILDDLRDRFGDFPLRAITPAMVLELQDALQATPTKANHTVALLRLVLNDARRRGNVTHNAAAKIGRIETAARTEIWDKAEEDRVLAHFRPSLRLAFMLLLYTLQRPSDVLAMTKGQVRERDGRMWVWLRQRKTGELIEVPVHARLEPLLRARIEDKEVESLLLVPSPTGKTWSRRNFSRAWDHDLALATAALTEALTAQGMSEEQVAAELQARHRQRRDLRRTGVVRLAEAKATVPQIAGLAGWRIDYTQRIVDTYLPRRTEVALQGIEAWEQADEGAAERVVRLADWRKG